MTARELAYIKLPSFAFSKPWISPLASIGLRGCGVLATVVARWAGQIKRGLAFCPGVAQFHFLGLK